MPHKGADPDDPPVSGLLCPRVLAEMGAFDAFPPVPGDYQVDGDWTQTYRIWGNSGRFRFQNKDMGCLTVRRVRSAGRIEFFVDRVLVNADGIEHISKAHIECRDDELATLVRWKLEVQFTDSSRCPRPELAMTLEGEAQEGGYLETCQGAQHRLEAPPPCTADWCLADVVQRNPGLDASFTVLEDLSKVKPGHRTARLRADLAEKLAADGMRPFCVYEVGWGSLPRQYWLDEAGRAILILSNAVVYILDDNAWDRKEKLVTDLIKGGVHYEY